MKEGYIALALAAALLLSACKPEPAKFAVAGIKIGDTRASVLSMAPKLACGIGERAGVEECTGDGPSFEGASTAFLKVNLADGKVEYVGAVVDATKTDQTLGAMKMKYGQVGKGETEAHILDPGITEWIQWGDERNEGKQILQIGLPEKEHYVVTLRGPMYMAMHMVMPRLELPAPDIKGVKLGSSAKDVRTKFPSAECSLAGLEMECSDDQVTYGGSQRARVSILLHEDSVRSIAIQGLNPEDYNLLVRAMIGKFGPPDDEQQRKSRAGLDPNDTVWSMPYNQLLIASKVGDGVSPSVSLLDMHYYGVVLQKTTKENVKTL